MASTVDRQERTQSDQGLATESLHPNQFLDRPERSSLTVFDDFGRLGRPNPGHRLKLFVARLIQVDGLLKLGLCVRHGAAHQKGEKTKNRGHFGVHGWILVSRQALVADFLAPFAQRSARFARKPFAR